MRVLVWPADLGAGGHYRLQWPAQALALQGADVTVDRVGPTCTWDRYWDGEAPPAEAHVLGVERPDADVVVLQRPARRQWVQVIAALQEHGVRVVVDVDDDLTAIPRANTAYNAYDPVLSPHHSHAWVSRACELADLVTVTTPALAKVYGGHGRVAVLPNLVPNHYLTTERAVNEAPLLGWAGNVETHPHDLEVTAGAVHRALLAVPDAKVAIVGTADGVAERLRCTVALRTGWVSFDRYPEALAGLDVGIVPLHSSRFNDAKSCLKGMEFASVGTVPVMSPSPDNRRLHGLGVGVLADSPSQWRKQLTRLLANPELRADVAGRSREVMAGLTYQGNAGLWAEAWARALDREEVAA